MKPVFFVFYMLKKYVFLYINCTAIFVKNSKYPWVNFLKLLKNKGCNPILSFFIWTKHTLNYKLGENKKILGRKLTVEIVFKKYNTHLEPAVRSAPDCTNHSCSSGMRCHDDRWGRICPSRHTSVRSYPMFYFIYYYYNTRETSFQTFLTYCRTDLSSNFVVLTFKVIWLGFGISRYLSNVRVMT